MELLELLLWEVILGNIEGVVFGILVCVVDIIEYYKVYLFVVEGIVGWYKVVLKGFLVECWVWSL